MSVGRGTRDIQLLKLHNRGLSVAEIVEETGWDYAFVYQRLIKLGFKPILRNFAVNLLPKPRGRKKVDLDEINWRNAAKDSGFF